MHGCAPSCMRMSMRSITVARAGQDRVGDLLRSTDQRVDAAVVVGVGVDVEQGCSRGSANARAKPRRMRSSRPSLTLGTASSTMGGHRGRVSGILFLEAGRMERFGAARYTRPRVIVPPSTCHSQPAGESEM